MKAYFSKFLLVVMTFSLFVGCNNESEDNSEEQRKNDYAKWIDRTVCRHVVDNLDYLFWASAHRDSLLCGGDAEAVIKRQFSLKSLPAPKFNESGEICKWKFVGTHTIKHNGISLAEDGAEWIAYSNMERFWSAPQQPTEVNCQWTVKRENGVYKLSGGMIHNGLWQEYFTLSEFSDMEFTITSDIVTAAIVNGVRETRRHISYCFDGDMDIMVLNQDELGKVQYETDITMSLDGVAGRNTKMYASGYPIFGSEDYFNGGKVDVTVFDTQAPWGFIIYYTQYGARY